MRMPWASLALFGVTGVAFAPLGCGHAAPAPTYKSREEMLKPETCGACHLTHFLEWSRSMHAYASKDPVFLAMNARGQRETKGTSQPLGTFCVRCHAPMAVLDGKTADGLNLASLPEPYNQGVTCFFCHSIASVDGSHNAALTLSNDLSMRGEITDPVSNTAHAATYSALLDRDQLASAAACGACHDIVTPKGGPIERTFCEWRHSAFNANFSKGGSTCASGAGCHMGQNPKPQPIAAAPNAPNRLYHRHDFPAVDVPAGASDADRASVQASLDNLTLRGALCVTRRGGIRVVIDPSSVGHGWPSGAAQDRRAWAEVVAYQGGNVVYQSGVVPDGTPVGQPTADTDLRDLWLLRDRMFDAQSNDVNMFWQAAGAAGNELPALTTFDPTMAGFYANHIGKAFPADGSPLPRTPDRVTLRIRLQAIGLDVLNDLVASGDLDPSIAASGPPPFDVSLVGPEGPRMLEWTPQAASAADAPTVQGLDARDKSPVTCVGMRLFDATEQNPARTSPTCQ